MHIVIPERWWEQDPDKEHSILGGWSVYHSWTDIKFTLVLHPPPVSTDGVADFDRAKPFIRPRSLSNRAVPFVTVVGLEACPPQLFGFPSSLDLGDMEAEVERVNVPPQGEEDVEETSSEDDSEVHSDGEGAVPPPKSFHIVSMAEWANTVHPLVAELPRHMMEAAAAL
jgi:hypothetical protein